MIPVSDPLLTEREVELVDDCVRSGSVSSTGACLNEFERKWAEYCGRKFGVAMCSGTAALMASVRALGLGKGDEVILPTFTIMSCAMAVIDAGATPVFVDADPQTWTMDIADLPKRITSRTRAIMPVHIYGHPVDMDPVLSLAEQRNLMIIEDASEAHGAEYLRDRIGPTARWQRCGSFGKVSAFSFHVDALVTTGEGGMALTDDPGLAERLRSYRNLCSQQGSRFTHEELGRNFRMTNLQAALGLGQLERIDEIVTRKRAIGREYTKRLLRIPALQLPVSMPWVGAVYSMFGIVLPDETGMTAADLAGQLQRRGVETRPFFRGMHEQPVLRKLGLAGSNPCPVATRLARQGLYLPSGVALTDGQLDEVCDAVHEALR